MKNYEEVEEIVRLNKKRHELSHAIEERNNLECMGIEWNTAKFVTLTEKQLADMDCHKVRNCDDIYIREFSGSFSYYSFGELFFKTNTPDVYVRVHFNQ